MHTLVVGWCLEPRAVPSACAHHCAQPVSVRGELLWPLTNEDDDDAASSAANSNSSRIGIAANSNSNSRGGKDNDDDNITDSVDGLCRIVVVVVGLGGLCRRMGEENYRAAPLIMIKRCGSRIIFICV